MEIFKEIEPLRAFLKEKRLASISIGLVPTMGALHEGHLSLIRASKAENGLTVATIYVNPTQFNNAEDLAKYPRTMEADIGLLTKEACDVLFIPSNGEMYPGEKVLKMSFDYLDSILEGKFRPGHFSGVGLVVSKLFNIVSPDRAYFGQKDYQQFKVIDQLREELKFSVTLKSVPIVREPSGLAMSSRNQRLSAAGREKARLLFAALKQVKTKILEGVDFEKAREEVALQFNQQDDVKLEYFEFLHRDTLQPLENNDEVKAGILLIAAFVNEIRLIDNMLLAE